MLKKLKLNFNIKNRVKVPKDRILVITNDNIYDPVAEKFIYNLNNINNKKREWFRRHAYFCLPLTMANQMGFIIKNPFDFCVKWNGGHLPEDTLVEYEYPKFEKQSNKDGVDTSEISIENPFIPMSHFGMGIVSIQTPWQIRTPKNVNTLVLNPPNFYIDGITHMSACVETDNLRRNFTFNLKITRQNEWITIPKDSPIGYFLPYPRYFLDNYKTILGSKFLDKKILEDERLTARLFGKERKNYDIHNPHGNGYRYMNGVDIYNNKFEHHQTSPSGEPSKCPFGFKKNK